MCDDVEYDVDRDRSVNEMGVRLGGAWLVCGCGMEREESTTDDDM